MASKKQIQQREIYKKGVELAKKKYSKYPENKKSRKAWNECLSIELKKVSEDKTPSEKKEVKNKPKKSKKNIFTNWDWND